MFYDEEQHLIGIAHDYGNGNVVNAYSFGYAADGGRRWCKDLLNNQWTWYPCGVACNAGELVEQTSDLAGTNWTTSVLYLKSGSGCGASIIRRNSEYHHNELLGLRHPYRKHLIWEQVPANLKTNVIASLKDRIPRQADITDCYLSPHKDRYAWRVTYWNKPPFLDSLSRWFPSYQKLAVPIIELWITDGIGNHPNLIGAQPGDPAYDFREPKAITSNTLHVHDVVWSPHEDLLGYVISDVFYTIRVPK